MPISLISVLAASLVLSQTQELRLEPAGLQTEAQILEERGDVQMVRRNYFVALESYSEAIRLNPKNPVLWNKIGIGHQQLSDTSHAKADYEKAIRLNPKYWQAINNLGTVYYSERNYKRAVRLYKQVLEIAPSYAIGYSNLGSALFARKKYPEAIAAYQKALQLDPDVFDHDKSHSVSMQANTAQDKGVFYFTLARIHAAANNRDKAMEYLRKAMEEDFRDTRKIYQDPAFAEVIKSDAFAELIQSLPAGR